MACTQSNEHADRMRLMSLHGISRDAWKRYSADGSWYYEITAPGFKYNLTDIAAAIGLHQLRKADKMHERRVQRAQMYSELLADIDELILPRELPNRIHSWHLYPLRVQKTRHGADRSTVISELRAAGISTSVHWMPLHLHPYYRDVLGYRPFDCPCAASIYPELISLPLYPDLTPQEVERICLALRKTLTGTSSISVGTDLETIAEENA
jgi:perosamine synthetase